MGASGDREKDLEDLGARIRAAREASRPQRSRVEGEARAASVAIRMVTELVVGIGIGAAMGYGLDVLLGTLPLFLIVFGLFGFVAGVKVMLRSADEINRRASERSAAATTEDEGGSSGAPGNGSGGKRG